VDDHSGFFWVSTIIKKWTPEFRYMAQDANGYWYSYKHSPIQMVIVYKKASGMFMKISP
jgi:hypothetical protein